MSQKVIKGTILCLHGFAQNGPVFSAKASGIRKMLKKKGYLTVFIDGPLKLTPADLPFQASSLGADEEADDPNFRGWIYTDDSKFDIQPSLNSIKSAYTEHGPFIGIIGFSQGAGIAALILNRLNEISGNEKALDVLKFAIFYSSFIFKNPELQPYYKPDIKVPTLHIFGELDTLVSSERSQALVDTCEDSTVFKHPGGHYVPNQKDILKRQVAWVEHTVETGSGQLETEKKEEEKVGSDDLDKLAEQIDKLGTA